MRRRVLLAERVSGRQWGGQSRQRRETASETESMRLADDWGKLEVEGVPGACGSTV